MTDKLRALLDERASAPSFDLPDLDAVRSAGLRRRRRTYAGATAGGVVATAAAAALVLGLVTGGDGPDDAVPVAVDPVTRGPLQISWADGDVIHDGDRTVRLEHTVRAYVRTSLGYVTVDPQGRVRSVVDGTEDQIGVVADGSSPLLVADPSSSQVVWLDERPATGFMVHDQADGTSAFVPVDPGPTPPDRLPVQLHALSGGAVVLRAGTQLLSVDLETDERTDLGSTTRPATEVLDAAAGQVAFVDTAAYTVSVGPDRSSTGAPFETSGGARAALSPDARHLAFTEDEGAVVDVATGRQLPLDLTGFYEPYEWWDGSRLAVVTETSPGSERARLASCDVVTGACRTEVADLGPFDGLEGFSVPVGDD